MGYIALTSAIWLATLLAISRYVAVCYPLHVRFSCTLTRIRIYIFIVCFASVVLNVPRFFQMKISYHSNSTYGDIEYTSIGEYSYFGLIYTNGLFSILVLLMPIVFMLILNAKLIMELRSQQLNRDALTQSSSDSTRKFTSITHFAVTVVILFTICHTPDRLLQLVRYIVSSSTHSPSSCKSPLFYVAFSSNLLIILNSATNFLVYCAYRRQFRRRVLKWLFHRCSESVATTSSTERSHILSPVHLSKNQHSNSSSKCNSSDLNEDEEYVKMHALTARGTQSAGHGV